MKNFERKILLAICLLTLTYGLTVDHSKCYMDSNTPRDTTVDGDLGDNC